MSVPELILLLVTVAGAWVSGFFVGRETQKNNRP